MTAAVFAEDRDVPESWQRLWDSIKAKFLKEAQEKKFSGQGTILIEFHQGGVTGKKFSLTWIEK